MNATISAFELQQLIVSGSVSLIDGQEGPTRVDSVAAENLPLRSHSCTLGGKKMPIASDLHSSYK
jgi:hypothetical protein